MVIVYEYAEFLRPLEEINEYACPECCKAIKWNANNKSPFVCSGCHQEIIDISALTSRQTARRAYHIDGRKAHELKIFEDIYNAYGF